MGPGANTITLRRGRAVAVAALAVLLAGCSGAVASQARSPASPGPASAPSHTSHPTTTTTTSTTTTTLPMGAPAPSPALDDLTWVSTTHGWALVEHSNCGQSSCTGVFTTTDGGMSWSRIGTIPATPGDCAGCDSPAVTGLRFANDLDGYAFAPDLFVTTDGGLSWSQEAGPSVAALEPAGANVMRVAYTQTGCPGPCDLTVQVATAGSATWRSLSTPFQGDAVRLVRQGVEDVYVAALENPAGGADDEHSHLMLSHNGGATWVDRADPCGVVGGEEFDTAQLTAPAPFVVAVLCQDRVQAQNSFVALSTNGGSVFTSEPLIPGGADQLVATSATSIWAGSSEPLGSGTTQYLLLSSANGGRSWDQEANDVATNAGTPAPPPSPFLGFESPLVGRWVVGEDVVWTTMDGGTTWTRQSTAFR